MTIKAIRVSDVEGFMRAIDMCEGQIKLRTPEGDLLNLKSTLSKIVFLSTKIFAEESVIREFELVVENEADAQKIIDYLVRG